MNSLFPSLNPNEVKLLETFSTYKIFTLEFISIFCNLRKEKSKADILKNEVVISENTSENSSLLLNNIPSKDAYLTSSQELKLINLILKSIKASDLDLNTLIHLLLDQTEIQIFIKQLQDRVDRLSQNLIIELKNLINALKIYFIGPNLADSFIKPWSVVGKYVRRCIIIYEKMSFDKLVILSKQATIDFKNISYLINQTGQIQNPSSAKKTEKLICSKLNQIQTDHQIYPQNLEAHYEIDNSTSPMRGDGLFLNDESNLTITSEWFNRSTNADYSCMDLEPLDESLTHPSSISSKPINQKIFNQKALTSTVSAQRTQSLSNFKSNQKNDGPLNTVASDILPTTSSKINQPTVTFQLPLQKETNSVLEGSIIGGATELNMNRNESENKLTGPFQNMNGIEFSRKNAEYFVAKQAYLLENNDYDALNPVELQLKIDELLSHDPNFADAYYLKYLNYLRLKDYPSALKALHDYFDRFLLAGSISLAALNLCSLEYRFDNKENSLFALKEAITSAHQEGDNACLQHCLSWLYKIEPFNNGASISRKNFLIKSACSRAISNELYNLASYNLHYFARNSIGKHKPQSILNLLNKADFVNLKMNSKMELQMLSQCNKASIWNLYGHRKISCLQSQMLLNLLPKSSSNKLNTESQCIAMCNLALDYSRNGMHTTSQNIINLCKELYSPNTKISEHWIYTENLIQIDKNILNGKFNMARKNIERLASVSIQQALLQDMNLYILEGNYDKAKETGNKILSNMNIGFVDTSDSSSFKSYSLFENSNNQFDFFNEQMNINLRFNFILIYIGLEDYSNALISAIKFHHEVKQLDFNYESMISCLTIAKILIHMDHPDQAIKYLQKCIVFILSNGSLLDQARLHYLYAKCLFILESAKNLESSLMHMNKCVEKLESIQGSIYLLTAYPYLSLLLNEKEDINARNKYAFKFRQLRQQLPLIGHLL